MRNKENHHGYLTALEAIAALEEVAQYHSEGCFTIMKFRDGWKCMLGTPNVDKESRNYISDLPLHKNLTDTITDRLHWLNKNWFINKAIREKIHGGVCCMEGIDDIKEISWFIEKAKNKLRDEVNEMVLEEDISVCPDIGHSRCASTGEEYLTLTSGGFETETIYRRYCWPQKAVDAFLHCFSEVIRGRTKEYTLYWRAKPKLRMSEYGYYVRCRMLLSKKEVLSNE